MTDEKFIERRTALEYLLPALDCLISLLSSLKLIQESILMAGYDLGKMDKPDIQGMSPFDKLIESGEKLRLLYETFREQFTTRPDSWEDLKDIFNLGKQLFAEYKKYRAMLELAGEDDIDYQWELVGLHVLKQLILRTTAIILPWAIQVLRFVNAVKVGKENEGAGPEKDVSGKVIRYPYRGIDFDKEGAKAFFDDPVGSLKKKYFDKKTRSRAIATPEDDLLLIRLRDLLLSLKLHAVYGFPVTDNIDIAPELESKIEELSRTLTTWFRLPGTDMTLALSFLRVNNAIRVNTVLNGDGDSFSFTTGSWNWALGFLTAPEPFLFSPDGIDFASEEKKEFRLNLNGSNKNGTQTAPAGSTDPRAIGAPKGTRLEPGIIELNADIHLNGNAKKANLELSLKDGSFILQPGDGDNFLRRILPENGIKIGFNLCLGYNNERGFYLDGSGGGEITIPVNKQFGKISIPALQLGFIKKQGEESWSLYASVSGRLELGPVKLELDKVGMALVLREALEEEEPNLLVLDADFDFKPPEGVGIEIDAGGVVTGGGYLYINRSRGEYFGIAALTIKDQIRVSAIGIIQTKLGANNSGYSFLLLISAEFPAIQLGMGFSLTGVGGLVGINRSLDLNKLKEGLYNNALDDILFPQNPLENAYGIISNINGIFPPAEGQYVFGLMARIEWGPKRIISLELGLILKFPSPVYIAIIGVLRAVVKKKIAGKELSVVELQVNFAAVIDFEKRFISLDATLYQSKLLQLSLEGDIAVRIKYGDNPDFAITIGGFHPDFEPPALNLPAVIRRLKIIIRSGNPEITASCYFAITSNTVQFGIAGLFLFEKWGVELRGELSFDALFQFSPFQFQAAVHFLLSASWKGYDFASIEVNGNFSGPSPWHVSGSLKLKVWIFSKTVSLEETWGDGDDTRIEQVDILPLLTTELENISQWQYRETSTVTGIILRKDKKAVEKNNRLIIHPNHSLTITQQTVPLGISLDRFAGRKPSGASKFTLAIKDKKGINLAAENLQQHFASAQFIDLSEEEQLHVPPYELFDHGVGITGLNSPVFDGETAVTVEYESDTIDIAGMQTSAKKKVGADFNEFRFSLKNNSLSNSFYATEKKPGDLDKKKNISEKYAIVDASTKERPVTNLFTSKAAAIREIRQINVKDGKQKTQFYFVDAVSD